MASYPMQIKEAESEKRDSSQRPIAFNHSDDEQVSVIRKEFVALTGDHFSAVILNQLLYWTQRVRDFDLLLEEERCFNPDCTIPPRHGWIYKSANDLIEETMLGMTHPTMRKYLKLLIDQGWIDERAHPNDKWNKTTQYRVNIRKLQDDLTSIGRNLPTAYLKAFSSSLAAENLSDSSLSSPSESEENPNVKNLHSSVSHLHSNVRNLHSYTYTETTSEIPNKEHTERTHVREVFPENYFKDILKIWKLCVGQDVQLTKERQRRLQFLFPLHFQNDLAQWRDLCERIKTSTFLMGHGPRGWRVSLDWVLVETNLLKVLEGNFDNPEVLEEKKEVEAKEATNQKKEALLDSITDPQWKAWCTGLKDHLTLFELEDLKDVRVEEFDGRLVVVTSSNLKALDRVESLRLCFIPILQTTYPKARNIVTRRDSQKWQTLGKNPRVTTQKKEGEGHMTSPFVQAGRLDKVSIPPPQFLCKDKLSDKFSARRQEGFSVKENGGLNSPSINTHKKKEKAC